MFRPRSAFVPRLARLALVLLALSALTGCALYRLLFGGGVQIGVMVEGEITYSDDSGSYTGGYFYWDSYTVRLKAGTRYYVEFWCEPEIPMHLNMSAIGEDNTTRADNDALGRDGYLYLELPSEFPSKLDFSVYLISDNMNDPTWYKFRFSEL